FSGDGDTTSGGSSNVMGSFAGQVVSYPHSTRAFNFSQCGGDNVALTSFTLGAPIISSMSLSASAFTGGPLPQAFADIRITGFQFFDASQNPVTDVTYTLVEEFPALEPASASLLVCGLLFLGLWRAP